jgi:hypothetical protein
LYYVDQIAPQNFTSYNNLFYTATYATEVPKVNNQYNIQLFSAYQLATARDLDAIIADPLFIDTNMATLNLHLQETSAAINTGSSLLISPTEQDYDGQSRINENPDLGADEFYATQTTTKVYSGKKLTLIPSADSQTAIVDSQNETVNFLQIFNTSGQLVKKISVLNGAQIDISDLPRGVYFAKSDYGGQAKFVR